MQVMLLLCPACNTRYVVPDAAIGVDGRQVRCANCKHSWFQDGVRMQPAPPAPSIVAPKLADEPDTAPTPPPPVVPITPPASEQAEETKPATMVQTGFAAFDDPPKPPKEQFLPAATPSAFEMPERSQFDHEPPFKPRRNPAKLWTMAAVAFALLIAIGTLAIWQFGAPVAGLASGEKEPDLKIVLNENQELNYRPDGTPFFVASGTIVNPSGETLSIPDMLVTLKDASGVPVYSWKMKAKADKIAPGGKVDFSEAQLDVPRRASSININWVLGDN
jgi:predicted Zn finger-like uncharacterized protein